ncbi:nucleotidyltransferase domain-containing protein [Nostocoides vanveenii]|uniref:Nucleotidyltransferase domain-containing protein n=1 Tax=Nostocoides vanveenii TaxID=330835 RepID=A0ABN2KPG9_9MICO
MRAIPETMDARVVGALEGALANLARAEGVKVLLAVESGSRAWGFPSPDSDYDLRFVYVRTVADYLTPWPARDVLGLPVDAVQDIAGWDLVKAVRLLANGNAVLGEWARSPIVYGGDLAFRTALTELAADVADPAAIVRHYAHVAMKNWPADAAAGLPVPLKKLFYALRPAAAVRWLLVHPGSSIPPMTLRELLAECDPPAALLQPVEDLLAAKAVGREMGEGIAPLPVREFVSAQLAAAATCHERRPAPPDYTRLSDFFRSWVPETIGKD